jgi:hypothetical protein
MRYAKNINGERMFDVTEYMTDKQINCYFSRVASKLKKGQAKPSKAAAPSVDVILSDEKDSTAAEDED